MRSSCSSSLRSAAARRRLLGLGVAALGISLSLPACAGPFRERMAERAAAREEAQAEADGAVTANLPAKGDPQTAQRRTLSFGGLTRTYLAQVPKGRGPYPVVVLLHGGTETSEDAWKETSLPTLGLSENFILVAPQGVDKHWNDGRGNTIAGDAASTADDVGFLKALIAETIRRDGGNANAVFMVGASNGGFMTMRFACDAAQLLRAAANVVSNLPQDTASNCRPAKALPWLSINGVQDPVIPFLGQAAGTKNRKGEPQPALLSADATFSFWADRNKCGRPVVQRIGRAVEKRTRAGCMNGGDSVQYVIQNSGHVYPGLEIKRPLIAKLLGGTNLEIDSGTTIWGFFKAKLAVQASSK